MARQIKKVSERTAKEVSDFYNSSNIKKTYSTDYDKTLKRIRDVTKSAFKTISTYDKSKLVEFLKNITSNEKQLRDLSWFLYYRSHIYKRIINFNATMFELNARSVIPKYDLLNPQSNEDTLKSYNETIQLLSTMPLGIEFLKGYINCFIQDVFYGIGYLDETGFFILPLDSAYCRISGTYMNGGLAFAYDMSYFRGNKEYLLDYYGEPFVSMKETYDETGEKWVDVPAEYAVCLKQDIEDWQTIVPPFSGLLMEVINLEDLKDIQAVADEQNVYKMIYLKANTLSGAKHSNEWAIDLDLLAEYFDRMIREALPEYTSAALVPTNDDLGVISFDSDQATDTTKVSKSTSTVLQTSGGAEVLDGTNVSGTEAFIYSQIANTKFAISSLLPQTEMIVNRLISYKIDNPCKVKFFEVSSYTKNKLKEDFLAGGDRGLPLKLAYNSLNTFSELETLSLNNLEENILDITNKLRPYHTSYTEINNDANRDTDEGVPVNDGEIHTDNG